MGCRYCERIFAAPQGRPETLHDRILFESNNFVAVPSLGSLVEGWLLVIPKQHYLCMGELPRGIFVQLNEFILTVREAVESCYGPVAIFEHGPSQAHQAAGCGVDHAHLHVVPTGRDLVKDLHFLLGHELGWVEVDGISDATRPYVDDMEYLYIEQPSGRARIAPSRGLGSQLFRRVIALHVGTPDRFDWKMYAGEENVRATVDRIGDRPGWGDRKDLPDYGRIEESVS